MARTDVLALVSGIANATSDATAVSRFYADAVYDLAQQVESSLDAAFVSAVAGIGLYTLPVSAIRAVALFHDDRELLPSTRHDAAAGDPRWRETSGTPSFFVTEDENQREFRVSPVPDRSGAAVGANTPFSSTFPGDNLTVIYAQDVTAGDVLPWEELLVTLEVLRREFSRESDHMDLTLAENAQAVARIVRMMLGYDRGE